MKRILPAILFLMPFVASAQSPTYSSLTVTGNTTTGSLTVQDNLTAYNINLTGGMTTGNWDSAHRPSCNNGAQGFNNTLGNYDFCINGVWSNPAFFANGVNFTVPGTLTAKDAAVAGSFTTPLLGGL
ncbi:MAG: hypothetical protein M0Z28_18155 [Rhodospirillales bacterium]|nr:hypothetical protein [Rhodospirillales bacterium]